MPACSRATIELSSPPPEPARGRVLGGGSPPPHEASARAAAPPSAPRRVSVDRMAAQTSLPAVRISRADFDELVAHAREEAPNECCGYLRASDGAVEQVFRAVNKRHSP